MEFKNRLIACCIVSIFALIPTSSVFAKSEGHGGGKGHGQAGNQGVRRDQKTSPNQNLNKKNVDKHDRTKKAKKIKKMKKNRNPMAATPAIPHHNGIPATPAVPGNPNAKENVLKNRAVDRP